MIAPAKAAQTDTFTVVNGVDGEGASIFSVLVKRTYDIVPGRRAVRAENDRPFVQADVYYDEGDPEVSSLKYEADLAPYKPATDVVLIGKVYAPRGEPVAQLDAVLEVADHRKAIRITGDRRCVYRNKRPPDFTDPVPFSELELRYERAYGGKDTVSVSGLEFYYPRNHLGSGLAFKNVPEVVDDLVLPNIEDADDMLTPDRVVIGELEHWNRQPLPQGFGWFQPTWYPRASFVGAVPGFVDVDEVMREETLGLVPEGQIALARQFRLPSFDVRFHNGASLGLALPYLRGDEEVRLRNLTPEGTLSFSLPADTPRIGLDIGLGENQLDAVLHTVCIRARERQVDLVWRGAHEYPGFEWLPEMDRLIAEVN